MRSAPRRTRPARALLPALRLMALTAIGAVALAGCSVGQDQPSPSASDSLTQQLPPVFVDPAAAAGKAYEVPLDSAIVLTVPDGEEAYWSGEAATPGIVTFQAGGARDSAVYNPGFTPESAGTTQATVTNTKTNESVTFTITVTQAAGNTP